MTSARGYRPDSLAPFLGRFRSHSPWLPYFEVMERKGRLALLFGEGGESSSQTTFLEPLGNGWFRPGSEPTPERLHFEAVIDGQALKATYSGHPFYRISRSSDARNDKQND